MASDNDDLIAKANVDIVRALTEHLRMAWQQIHNDYGEQHGSGMTYLDGMMACHNFFKLALDHQIADSGVTGEKAAFFYLAAGETFRRAMKARAEQMRTDLTRAAGELPVDRAVGKRRIDWKGF